MSKINYRNAKLINLYTGMGFLQFPPEFCFSYSAFLIVEIKEKVELNNSKFFKHLYVKN